MEGTMRLSGIAQSVGFPIDLKFGASLSLHAPPYDSFAPAGPCNPRIL